MRPSTLRTVPKKKKPRGHPARHPAAGNQLSPLRAGGRVLGDLQVPFRRFLEAERAEDGEQEPGEASLELPVEDVEARLMESLGWLVLSLETDLVPAAARRFDAADLSELFTEIVPAVAEHNDLDAQELVDETRLAWTSYLMFLGESEQWAGEPEELADCLDVASGGVAGAVAGQGSVLDALTAAEAAVPLADRLEDLRASTSSPRSWPRSTSWPPGWTWPVRNCPRAPSSRWCVPAWRTCRRSTRSPSCSTCSPTGCSSWRTAGPACRTRPTPNGATSWPPSSWPPSSPGCWPTARRRRRSSRPCPSSPALCCNR